MLYRLQKMIGMTISASDGEIGKVKDVYFDDRRWALRYLVVETGGWLDSRQVLISPIAVDRVDWEQRVVHVFATREQVRGSPPVDTEQPVSRQHEMEYFSYYGYPDYWSGALLWGASLYPMVPTGITNSSSEWQPEHAPAVGDPHLRSTSEVVGYHLQASDAMIGHLEDFLIEAGNWAIRYVVVDTVDWWPGKHVVVPPQWIIDLDWAGKTVRVDVTSDAVRQAPEYDPSLEMSRADEASLYQHYRRPEYWM